MEPDNRIWYAVWNMELKNDPGTIVGDFCFKRIGKDGVVEIGYGLKEPYRYHGYMSETVKAITEWVLLQDNVRIVEAAFCTLWRSQMRFRAVALRSITAARF